MKFKRQISILLALIMTLSTASYCVFATEEVKENENKQTEASLASLPTMDSFTVTPETEAGEATLAWNVYTWNEGTGPVVTKYADTYKVYKGTDVSVDASYFVERKGDVGSYTYDVFEGKDNTGTLIADGLDSISFRVTGLEGWKTQEFTVQAYDGTNPKAQGSASAEITGTYPDTVTGVDALADYNAVDLKWNAVAGAVSYNIYDGNGAYITNTTATSYSQYAEKYASYTFMVKAVNAAGKESQNFSNADTAGRVRTYYNYVTFKKTRTLKCYCSGKKIKMTFKKGTQVRAEGFQQARYMFYYNGHKFYVSRLSMKANYCDYNPYVDYTAEEATNYVNHRGISSKTGYLMWANLYSQRVYVFSGYAGHWTLINSFECSSGKCSTPSPSGEKKIGTKKKKRHGRLYWSCYSSWNAMHDLKGKEIVGVPKSNGCIRLQRANAYYVYSSIPKKTKVLVF